MSLAIAGGVFVGVAYGGAAGTSAGIFLVIGLALVVAGSMLAGRSR